MVGQASGAIGSQVGEVEVAEPLEKRAHLEERVFTEALDDHRRAALLQRPAQAAENLQFVALGVDLHEVDDRPVHDGITGEKLHLHAVAPRGVLEGRGGGVRRDGEGAAALLTGECCRDRRTPRAELVDVDVPPQAVQHGWIGLHGDDPDRRIDRTGEE